MRAVLMLHSIDSSGSAISLTAAELRGLVRSVRASGHAIVPLSELLQSQRPDCIALTFDDGFASLAELAAPVLQQEGTAATLFLTTGYVGRDNRWPSQPSAAPRLPLLSWDGVTALHRAGWEIEAHTENHPDLRTLSDEQLAEELEAPQREIEQRLGRAPSAFAYPYGLLDDRAVEAVRARYAIAVTTRMAALPELPEAPQAEDAGGDLDLLRVPRLDAYYLRHSAVRSLPGGFGGPAFRALVGLRGALRRLRDHPGEHS